jgi:multidrug efflux pump subunit AcrA (membrane-fusion protein)
MQKQLYATIKEQSEKLKLAESEYGIMERELGDGNVCAEIDGKVVSVLTEEEARQQNQPLLKVSGGGGFYVEGSVSELDKEALKLGQEVTVNDWNTGNVYTGTVQSLGDFPITGSGWNGMGNPNASFYPFTVFVEEEADLQEGRYVNFTYSTAGSEHGIYLQNPFLRTEQGKSYVYVLGEDGRLEQRLVKTGKALWGSYMEILSGLTEEDMVAFPYGKNVRDGAIAVEGDMSDLYG